MIPPARAPDLDTGAGSEYAVIDVETANPARRSICQIGLVIMRGDREIEARSWLVDPDGPVTLSWVHGITEIRHDPTRPDPAEGASEAQRLPFRSPEQPDGGREIDARREETA